MLIDRLFLKPLFAPENEAGVDTGTETAPPPVIDEGGPGSGRSALRKQLETNFESDRKGSQARDEKAAKEREKTPRRVAGGAAVDEEVEATTEEAQEGTELAETGTPEQAIAAPEGLSKEAKSEWAKVPPVVAAAVTKRLADSAKGVEEIKQKYAGFDAAIAPHMEAIRRTGNSPAKAVEQLFAWFQALSVNPKVAFPALAKSFGQDINSFVEGQQQAQAPAQDQTGNAVVDDLPPAAQKLFVEMQQKLGGLEQALQQKIGGLEQTFQQQSEEKTHQILANWSKDKPHFEAVRGLMAQFIASGAVPLNNGNVDLDRAYDMAVFANPEVRQQMLEAQQKSAQAEAVAKAKAEKAAQQAQAEKSRRAAGSLSPSAPGSGAAATAKPKGKGMSVRESLMAAREELSS